MDWKIELVAIPVTDVDRAKAFYVEQVGFNADHDYQVSDELRFVQLTPPGSACSVVMGTGVTEMPPGSQKGVQVVVADVQAAREELLAHGVPASDVDVQPWGSFVTFSDPDGNTWALQQIPRGRSRLLAAPVPAGGNRAFGRGHPAIGRAGMGGPVGRGARRVPASHLPAAGPRGWRRRVICASKGVPFTPRFARRIRR